jgi:hypothetical protein
VDVWSIEKARSAVGPMTHNSPIRPR